MQHYHRFTIRNNFDPSLLILHEAPDYAVVVVIEVNA